MGDVLEKSVQFIWKTRERSVSPVHKSGKQKTNIVQLKQKETTVNSLHRTLGPLLTVAQFSGVLPVQGILNKSPRNLKFSPKAFRALYAYVILISIAIMALLSLIHMARSLRSDTFSVLGGLAAATGGAVFYGNAFCATWLFIKLSTRWKNLMKHWTEVELRLDHGNTTLFSKFQRFPGFSAHLLTATILLLASAEHGLSIALNLRAAGKETNIGWLENYALNSHGFIFAIVEYSALRGMLILILSHIATFTWNFMDLFIMLMCQALTQRFCQFNTQLLAFEGKLMRLSAWREAREQYAALAALTRALDRNIAGITLLSFSNNLYFICMQLLNGLAPTTEPGIIHFVYFWGSFAFLVGRTGAVTLHASNVHHASRGALPVLFACPSPAFCEDAARLQQHMCGEELALTGLGLFHVTRSFMLAVAGAIATYEVVLLQFNVAMTTQPGATCTATAPPSLDPPAAVGQT